MSEEPEEYLVRLSPAQMDQLERVAVKEREICARRAFATDAKQLDQGIQAIRRGRRSRPLMADDIESAEGLQERIYLLEEALYETYRDHLKRAGMFGSPMERLDTRYHEGRILQYFEESDGLPY